MEETREKSRLRLKIDSTLDSMEELLAGPRAARLAVGVIAVIVALFVGSVAIYDSWVGHRERTGGPDYPVGTHLPNNDSPEAKAKTETATKYMDHVNFHYVRADLKDGKVFYDDSEAGKLEVRYYDSDKCLWVYRKKGNDIIQEFVPNASGPESIIKNAWKLIPKLDLGLDAATDPNVVEASFNPTQSQAAPVPSAHLLTAQYGQCLNPHPGPFNWWWGPPQGCWVPMYRQWGDGCQHYQLYNSCAGIWDAQIHWAACRH